MLGSFSQNARVIQQKKTESKLKKKRKFPYSCIKIHEWVIVVQLQHQKLFISRQMFSHEETKSQYGTKILNFIAEVFFTFQQELPFKSVIDTHSGYCLKIDIQDKLKYRKLKNPQKVYSQITIKLDYVIKGEHKLFEHENGTFILCSLYFTGT